MTDYGELTLAQARAHYYAQSHLPEDGGWSARRWTLVTIWKWPVHLPNFAWRRRAIGRHDLHHLITGYPCSIPGELQIAAWEFAAGGLPSLAATLFCLPLVAIGALITPRCAFAAFVRGRRSRSLYAATLTDELLTARVAQLRARMLPAAPPRPTWRDGVAYAALLTLSLLLVLGPALAVALICIVLVF